MLAPMDILVIGIGNPLRGDDAAGWLASEILQNEYSLPPLEHAEAEVEPPKENNGNPGKSHEAHSPLEAKGNIEVHSVHQLTPELAEPASRAQWVLFLDASVEGAPGTISEFSIGVGEISCIPEKSGANSESQGAIGQRAVSRSTTHHLTPEALLIFARQLYGRAPRAVLLTLTGEDFGYRETLSPKAQAAFGDFLDRARSLIKSAS